MFFHNYLRERNLTFEDLQIEVVETAIYEKGPLKILEGMIIKYWKPKCNNNIPGRTDAEYYQDNKEKIAKRVKLYKQTNKEKITESNKQYYQEKKDKILEQRRQYYQTNKDKIAERVKLFKQSNHDNINEKRRESKKAKKEASSSSQPLE